MMPGLPSPRLVRMRRRILTWSDRIGIGHPTGGGD
jgi:hypothetical protein